MPRSFYALWPNESTRQAIAEASRHVPHHGRPVAIANYHLTLVFLGQVTAVQIEGLMQETSKLTARPFTLTLDRAGWWNGPRVLWLAPTRCPGPQLQLVEGLSDLARRKGIAVEERPYSPHLTIARKVRDFEDSIAVKPIRWRIREFHLLVSKSLKSGVVYEPLASWPLAPGAS